MTDAENIANLVHKLAHGIFANEIAVLFVADEKRARDALKYVQKNQARFEKLVKHLPVENYELKKNAPLSPPALIYAPKGYR